MLLTPKQTILMFLAVALGVIVTRFTPFIIFPENRRQPKIITYLGSFLPPAMMGLLVVYCLRNVSAAVYPYALPELISIAVIAVLHLWKRNVLLSIGAGTAVYMILVQAVFV